MRITHGRLRPWTIRLTSATTKAMRIRSSRAGVVSGSSVCAAARVTTPRIPAQTMTTPSFQPSGDAW
jgi:hypothetical protein